MASTYTTNVRFAKPATDDSGWGDTVNGDIDQLDALTPVGGLAVAVTENPSASLNVRVAPGSFVASNGTITTYAGTTSFACTLSVANYLWLTDAGVLTKGTAWPSTPYVPLAIATAGTTTITSIDDARVVCAITGASPRLASKTVSTAYTATTADGLLRGDTTSAGFTITLPAASGVDGLRIIVAKTVAANTLTIGSTSNINGATTTTITAQYGVKTFIADATSNTWNAF